MRSHLVQLTSKISALAKSGNISDAQNLFDEMFHKDTVAWNAMITGYLHLGLHQKSLSLFTSMRIGNMKPDNFTFTVALSTCAGLKDLRTGEKIHGMIFVSGYDSLLPVNNALIDMYGKCLKAERARKVFQDMGFRNDMSYCSLLFGYVNVGILNAALAILYDMPRRVVVAWNTVIAGYGKWGEVELAMDLFKRMLRDYCIPDQWTLSSIMNACSEMAEPCHGVVVHGFIIRSGWFSAVEVNNSVLSFYTRFGQQMDVLKAVEAFRVYNEVSWNTIIDAYMKLGNIPEACLVFRRLTKKNLISWTSMVAGFMRNGQAECAVKSFADMTKNGLRPDDVVLGAVLQACSNLATLGHAKTVHCCVVKSGFHSYPYVGNGLVNIYAKCGDICDSHKAFNDILVKDLISWNTMLFAYGLHGYSTQAFGMLQEMVASRTKPDKVTFIGLLMTCSHLGLINEGLSLFESMSSIYGLSPEIDHVSCVVDMLSRNGNIEKAKKLVNEYIAEKNVKLSSLEALFGSYSAQDDLLTGAELGKQLQILKPDDEMSYVLLSNLYCASGKWNEAENLRKVMEERGVKKMPGCSWIEVRNQVTTFVAGKNTFLFMDKVRTMLYVIECEARNPSSVLYSDGITLTYLDLS